MNERDRQMMSEHQGDTAWERLDWLLQALKLEGDHEPGTQAAVEVAKAGPQILL